MKKLALALLLIAPAAHAEFLDGNKLYANCTSQAQVDWGDCIGYISGVFDANHGVIICPPSNTTRGQVRDMVVVFMREYPQYRSETADRIVVSVLKAAWPCRQQNPTRNAL